MMQKKRKTNYRTINDNPILSYTDDQYDFKNYAKVISDCIINIDSPFGEVVGVNGGWGSGKSSLINIVQEYIRESKNKKTAILNFKVWWYRNDEELGIAFLQELEGLIIKNNPNIKEEAKSSLQKLSSYMNKASPLLTAIMEVSPYKIPYGEEVKKILDAGSGLLLKEETLEEIFKQVCTILESQDVHFIVVIDDIDRLNKSEILAIFKIIKTIGRLPKVTYLVAFDMKIVSDVIKDEYLSDTENFMNKIVQVTFDMPVISLYDRQEYLMKGLLDLSSVSDEERFFDVFYKIICPYLDSPRKISKYLARVSIVWPSICEDIDYSDFLALEAIRLCDNKLYNEIVNNRLNICYEYKDGAYGRVGSALIAGVLNDLFPTVIHEGFGRNLFFKKLVKDKRLCLINNFESYLRLNIGRDLVPNKDLTYFLNSLGKHVVIEGILKNSAQHTMSDGRSLIVEYLNNVTIRGADIEYDDLKNFVIKFMSIYDNLQSSMSDDKVRFNSKLEQYSYVLLRILLLRRESEDKKEVLKSILKKCSLGWFRNLPEMWNFYRSKPVKNVVTDEEIIILNKKDFDDLILFSIDRIKNESQDNSYMCNELINKLESRLG